MAIRVGIILCLIFLLGCSQEKQNQLEVPKESRLPEQVAVDYLFDELINRDSLFYITDENGELLNLLPQTFLEDSLFTDGLFFWKKLYATEKVSDLSKVSYTSYELELYEAESDEIQRTKEFEKDFSIKAKLNIPLLEIKLPQAVSVIDADQIKHRHLDNSLFLEVKHHLNSSDQYLVEISVYNLEYDEYKNIRFFLDEKYNVLDWKM